GTTRIGEGGDGGGERRACRGGDGSPRRGQVALGDDGSERGGGSAIEGACFHDRDRGGVVAVLGVQVAAGHGVGPGRAVNSAGGGGAVAPGDDRGKGGRWIGAARVGEGGDGAAEGRALGGGECSRSTGVQGSLGDDGRRGGSGSAVDDAGL